MTFYTNNLCSNPGNICSDSITFHCSNHQIWIKWHGHWMARVIVVSPKCGHIEDEFYFAFWEKIYPPSKKNDDVITGCVSERVGKVGHKSFSVGIKNENDLSFNLIFLNCTFLAFLWDTLDPSLRHWLLSIHKNSKAPINKFFFLLKTTEAINHSIQLKVFKKLSQLITNCIVSDRFHPHCVKIDVILSPKISLK